MSSKTIIYIGMIIGTTIGGFLPSLWGADMFSLSSVFLSAAGGVVGIIIGYKMSN
jgi:hypothetical protein